jgi:hypothetical protein
MHLLQRAQPFVAGGGQHHHGAGAGQEGAHRPPASGVPVRAQHGERVAVAALADQVEIGGSGHHGLSRWLFLWWWQLQSAQACGATCQICAAYSRMVRSAENGPMPATLAMALRDQASGSLYNTSTFACVAT